jgi:hypothetical protein
MRNIFELIMRLWLATVSTLALADLSNSALVPKEEAAFAKNYSQKIQTKDFAYVKSMLDPSLSSQTSEQDLLKIANYFPSGKLLSTELIGSQVNTFNSVWQGNFSYEYHFENGWALANVVLRRNENKLIVVGFHVYQTKASQKELNKFTLQGKSILQYTILAGSTLIPLFILASLIACVKTPIPKKKWLWIIFILGGIGTISTNWTTGEYGFKIVQYQLFGSAAVAASEYSPWVITAGFPLGAIIFWFKRNKWKSTMVWTPPI